mmetsp:Transcript_12929/g.25290  ORF Transcript_12929/g.25290 Transcript_12929/m.25290 type:complete len:208 (+) Transcript_12929:231-854(+)
MACLLVRVRPHTHDVPSCNFPVAVHPGILPPCGLPVQTQKVPHPRVHLRLQNVLEGCRDVSKSGGVSEVVSHRRVYTSVGDLFAARRHLPVRVRPSFPDLRGLQYHPLCLRKVGKHEASEGEEDFRGEKILHHLHSLLGETTGLESWGHCPSSAIRLNAGEPEELSVHVVVHPFLHFRPSVDRPPVVLVDFEESPEHGVADQCVARV